MSRENNLVFPASIDLAGLDRDLKTAEGMVGEFADGAASRLGNLGTPNVSAGRGSGTGAAGAAAGMAPAIGALAATVLPIGSMLASSIAGAIGPIRGTMAEIGKVISHQLDKQAKFTRLTADINQIKDHWKLRVEAMSEDFRHFNAGLKLKMDKLPPGSVVPPEDLATLAKIRAMLADVKKMQAAAMNSASQALGSPKEMQSAHSLFTRRRQKPFEGGGGEGANAGLGKLAASTLPKATSGMLGLGGATKVASKAAEGLGYALKGALMAGPIAMIFAAGSALVGFFKGGIKGSSDLNETMARTEIVLGTSTGKAVQFADEMATRFGMVKGVTLDTAASISGLARNLGGLKGDQLGEFSIGFTKLAAELAAFSHVDMGAASEALRMGLTGNQSDLLKQRGVVMDVAKEKAYAYAHGIAKVGEELNEQQKFAARAGMITRGLAKVNGFLESTEGSAANQAGKLMGTLSNLGTTIGAIVLPALTEGLKLLNEFGGWAMKVFTENAATVESWKESFLSAFDWVVATVHNFPAAFEVARLMIFEKLTNIGECFAVLGPNAIRIAKYIGDNWLLLIGDALDATLTALKNLWTNWQAIGTAIGEWFADPTQGFHVDWTPLLDGFRATAEKFPELLKPVLTDMSKEIAAASAPIADEVAARRASRALGAPAAKVLGDMEVDPAAPDKKKGNEAKDFKFSAALELGSKEAYSSIAEAFSGAGRSKGMDALAQSGKQTAGGVGELVKLQREANKKGPKMGGKALVIA